MIDREKNIALAICVEGLVNGGDRNVDRGVAVALGLGTPDSNNPERYWANDNGDQYYHQGSIPSAYYTFSTDAVLALIPGWAFPRMHYEIERGWVCQMVNSMNVPFEGYCGKSNADRQFGFTLAMLAATLRLLAGQAK